MAYQTKRSGMTRPGRSLIKPVSKETVKQILQSRQECKVFTSGLTAGVALAPGGTLLQLTPIQQGDNIGNRSGDQIYMKDLVLRIVAFQAVAATSCTFRVMVFSDSMGSGGVVGVSEVLETVNFTSGIAAINRQRNRFRVFHDKFHVLVGATNTQEVCDDIRVRINQTRYFNDASTAATNIGKNALYCLVIASAANGVFAHQWQLCYTDS